MTTRPKVKAAAKGAAATEDEDASTREIPEGEAEEGEIESQAEPRVEPEVAEEGGPEKEEEEGPVEEEEGGPEEQEAAEPTPEEQIADLKDQLLRAMAETENIRRRAQRDVQDTSRYAVSNFARDVLSIGDNLTRALDSVPQEARETNEALASLLDGVTMTQREFLTTIERHGIKRIEPMGVKFDHNFHQAMFEVEDADNEPGTVVQVVQVGYMIGDRLLRPAMVGIAKQPGAAGPGNSGPTKVDTKV